jgi:S-methylmethionine-dependent homocysteine/selenocysteine methylase
VDIRRASVLLAERAMREQSDAPEAKKARIETLYEKMTSSGPLLLDGEVGGLLWKRVKPENKTTLVPASIILDEPETVKQMHLDYIEAGAQVITANTYATVRTRLRELLGCAEKWEESIIGACKLAVEAREKSGKDVLICGTLPPLHGSYKPESVGAMEDIVPVYAEHVAKMTEYVDFFLCETMSTAAEGWAACSEAKKSGKPVWVAWTIKDDASGLLRSGESLQEAWDAVSSLQPDGVLVNCCTPESISAALPILSKFGPKIVGGHGNAFSAIPSGWKVQNGGIAKLGKREDLTPERYAEFVQDWLRNGANLVGGCCQVGPEFIKCIHTKMVEEPAAQ